MKTTPRNQHRTISETEVQKWFGKSCKHKLSSSHYAQFAERLTLSRWPGDPPDRAWHIKKPEPDQAPDRWWDFAGVFDAAKLLIKSAPAMASHWRGLELAPETSGGTQAIETLEKALIAALPYIKFPFGGAYRRQAGRKRPKLLHIQAVIIARDVIKALSDAGQPHPAISRNSVVARVVRCALIRMGWVKALQVSTVAQQLERWYQRYGLRPITIARLTKKHEADICALLAKWPKLQSPSTFQGLEASNEAYAVSPPLKHNAQ